MWLPGYVCGTGGDGLCHRLVVRLCHRALRNILRQRRHLAAAARAARFRPASRFRPRAGLGGGGGGRGGTGVLRSGVCETGGAGERGVLRGGHGALANLAATAAASGTSTVR